MGNNKLFSLIDILKGMQSAVLAYSGGVDSTFLLKALQLSGIRTLAVTAVSEIMPRNDIFLAKEMAEEIGTGHRIIKTEELFMEEFVTNTPERCFFCKDERFRRIEEIALSEKYSYVLDGSNTDDTSDYRPGTRAALKHHVRSPLIEAGFSKKEIRELSRQLGLRTWDRPSSSCLATRIPYGQKITGEALTRIEAAEDFLRSLGFRKVRVRDHDDYTARIEIGEDEVDSMIDPERRRIISGRLKSLGYIFVSLDLDGYKSGNMNRALE